MSESARFLRWVNGHCGATRLIAVFCAWSVGSQAWGRVIYVNGAAGGAASGLSWADAYMDLQDALDDVRAFGGCPCEIWMAQGLYTPDRGTLDRTMSFELADGLALYGGFGGWEECLDERQPALYETVLSGDLVGDDAGHPEPTSSCCTVTYEPGCDDPVCAEVANANDPSQITCETWWDANCMFLAQKYCCDLCRPGRCDNSYTVLRADGPQVAIILDTVTVSGGEGVGGEQQGGGLYVYEAHVTINACTFRANMAYDGPAMFIQRGAATITNTAFVESVARGDGGSAITAWGSDLLLEDCGFTGNRGGGIELFPFDGGTSARIERCHFVDNVAPILGGGGIRVYSDCDAHIIDSQFIGNRSNGGAALLTNGYTTIEHCAFLGNQAQASGGAISKSGALILTNSVFIGNRAGGITFYPYQTPEGGFAGAVDNAYGDALILNCTFANNYASTEGGIWGGFGLSIRNSILWGNTDELSDVQGAQLGGHNAATLDIDHSIVAGWTGGYGSGVGNTGVNPRFVDVDGADDFIGTEDDDVRLRPGSPAINAGNPDPTALPAMDLDGHRRVLCEAVDIGAYEFGIGDYDCNQAVDLTDFAAWESCMTGPSTADTALPHEACAAFDFDGDGDVDLHDFYLLQHMFVGP